MLQPHRETYGEMEEGIGIGIGALSYNLLFTTGLTTPPCAPSMLNNLSPHSGFQKEVPCAIFQLQRKMLNWSNL